MHRKIRQIEIGILIVTVCFGFAGFAQAGEPLDLVRTAVDKAVQILKDPKLQSQDKKRERIERLREALNPIFDYEEMAKRALGTHWRRRTPAEQEEFVKLFRDFLERTYSDKVDLYGGEKVRFGREVIDKDFAQVESTIVTPQGKRSRSSINCGKTMVNGKYMTRWWRTSVLSTIIVRNSIESSPAPLTKN